MVVFSLSCSTVFLNQVSFLSIFFQFSFNFILWSVGTAKSTILQVLSFLLIIIRSGILVKIRWSVYTSKSDRRFCVSLSRTDAGLCIYHLLVWSNLNFLHNSQWITSPTQSCLVLYSFYGNLLSLLFVFTNIVFGSYNCVEWNFFLQNEILRKLYFQRIRFVLYNASIVDFLKTQDFKTTFDSQNSLLCPSWLKYVCQITSKK